MEKRHRVRAPELAEATRRAWLSGGEATGERAMWSDILDTDDDGPDSVSDADKSDDDVDTMFSPSPKKAKLSAQEAGKPLVISDAEGVPMFNPNDIHHPNSTEWFPADHVGDYVAARLRTSLDKQTRAKLRSE
ncbi:hypothetical protein NDU88_007364 [Pleurodeles waltl]|uniref:Uncharacterized protein n=1 Tax=Pleurodeles waltl TaxID=8319 RepID=A0AAV7LSD5_PLEWA|nr:hypothetical protein NDU88_007364 [Pleurodeles waltl]